MVRKAAVVLAALFSAPSIAHAQAHPEWRMASAQDVMLTCQQSDIFSSGLCMGFVKGLMRRDQVANIINPGSGYLCELPAGLSHLQMAEVIVTRIKAQPEKWHFDGGTSALIALRDGFCKK